MTRQQHTGEQPHISAWLDGSVLRSGAICLYGMGRGDFSFYLYHTTHNSCAIINLLQHAVLQIFIFEQVHVADVPNQCLYLHNRGIESAALIRPQMNAWLHFKANTDKVMLSWPMKTQLHQPDCQSKKPSQNLL